MSVQTARAWKPWRTVGPDGWRGARIVSVTEAAIVIELVAEQSCIRRYTVARCLYPHAAPGNAAIAKVANVGEPVDDYVIVEIRDAQFCGAVDHTDAAPNHGHVAYDVTSECRAWQCPGCAVCQPVTKKGS